MRPLSPSAAVYSLFPLISASNNTTWHAAVFYLSSPYLPGQLLNLFPLFRPKAFSSCLICSMSFNNRGSHGGLRSQGKGSNLVESKRLNRTPPSHPGRCRPRSSPGPWEHCLLLCALSLPVLMGGWISDKTMAWVMLPGAQAESPTQVWETRRPPGWGPQRGLRQGWRGLRVTGSPSVSWTSTDSLRSVSGLLRLSVILGRAECNSRWGSPTLGDRTPCCQGTGLDWEPGGGHPPDLRSPPPGAPGKHTAQAASPPPGDQHPPCANAVDCLVCSLTHSLFCQDKGQNLKTGLQCPFRLCWWAYSLKDFKHLENWERSYVSTTLVWTMIGKTDVFNKVF